MTTVICSQSNKMAGMDTIQSKKIKTKNIQESLKLYALENSVPSEECDFVINAVANYIKTTAHESFVLFNENINEHYKEKEKILNEHVEFQQIYTITLSYKPKQIIQLEYNLELDKFVTHPNIILKPSSHIPYQKYKAKDIFVLLVKEINKIKAKNKLLINIFDTAMIQKLKLFTKHLYAGKFTKNIRIPLFEGIEPEFTRESKLILHFKKKEKKEGIIEVESGEVLIEYIKPVYGKNGLNAYGKRIHSGIINKSDDFQGAIDTKSIKIVEDADKKLYISKMKGYIYFSNNKLAVENKVKMQKLSRVQGSLTEEEDNNIEVIVAQNDTSKDSIGEGVQLTSETIHITGHIGAKSVLEALHLQVDGATHQDSLQYAKYANINRHKGLLRCHEAKITLLEGGEVHATYADIETCLGGSVYAQDVTIGHVKNNLKVYASNSITLRLVSGEDNAFTISYKDVPVITSHIEYLHRDIAELKEEIEDVSKHSPQKIPALQAKIDTCKAKLHEIEHSIENATITIQEPLKGLNTIIFKLNNGDEIIYKTQAMRYEPFYLEFKEDMIILHPTNKSILLNS